MLSCIIIIPIYLERFNHKEEASIRLCETKLSGYRKCFIAPRDLDVRYYHRTFPKIDIISFESKFFKSLGSYSRLLLSPFFYKKFVEFDYMLIYQPDAWLFSDNLAYWCSRNYDYIGAPFFARDANGKLTTVQGGNGGFSLRKIKTCLQVLYTWSYVVRPSENWSYRKEKITGFFSALKQFLGFIADYTYRNNTFFLCNTFVGNEDIFWSVRVPKLLKWYNVASPEVAKDFSFENFPEILYELNNAKLPFGCHAWEKYNIEFWKQHIKI